MGYRNKTRAQRKGFGVKPLSWPMFHILGASPPLTKLPCRLFCARTRSFKRILRWFLEAFLDALGEHWEVTGGSVKFKGRFKKFSRGFRVIWEAIKFTRSLVIPITSVIKGILGDP